MTKVFRLRAHEITALAPGRGGCIASDRITVDGMPVGYMVRSRPLDQFDSGWAFLAGDEDQGYLDDPELHGIYDVNTIANHDPAIIPFLDAPEGWRLVRGRDGLFYELEEPEYDRVDPRTAAFIEQGGGEGRAGRRRGMVVSMWMVVGGTVLACAAILLWAL